MPYHDNRKSLRGAALSAVITGLVPVIPLGVAQLCLPKRDGRHIGARKHAVLRTTMPYHDNRKSLRGAALSAVITGLVPVIPLRVAQLCLPKRDGRHIGARKHAVLRTTMPGHDKLRG